MEDYYQYGQKLVSGVEVPCTKAEQSAAHSVCKAVVTTEDTFTASHTVITVSNKYWATDKSPVNGFKGTAITSAECTGANDRFWTDSNGRATCSTLALGDLCDNWTATYQKLKPSSTTEYQKLEGCNSYKAGTGADAGTWVIDAPKTWADAMSAY